jgi:hypothetical protein
MISRVIYGRHRAGQAAAIRHLTALSDVYEPSILNARRM